MTRVENKDKANGGGVGSGKRFGDETSCIREEIISITRVVMSLGLCK